jgi:hypothetical protein
MNDIDPNFRSRREKELEQIPNTRFETESVILPQDSKSTINEEKIQKKILASKKDES